MVWKPLGLESLMVIYTRSHQWQFLKNLRHFGEDLSVKVRRKNPVISISAASRRLVAGDQQSSFLCMWGPAGGQHREWGTINLNLVTTDPFGSRNRNQRNLLKLDLFVKCSNFSLNRSFFDRVHKENC